MQKLLIDFMYSVKVLVNSLLLVIKLWIFDCATGSVPLTLVLFKGQLHMQGRLLDYVLKLIYFITSSPHLSLSKVLVMLLRLPKTVGLGKGKTFLI